MRSTRRALIFLLLSALTPAARAAFCPDPAEFLGTTAWRAAGEVRWRLHGENHAPGQTYATMSRQRLLSVDLLDGAFKPVPGSGELAWRVETVYPFAGRWQYRETLAADPAQSRLDGTDGFRPSPGHALPAIRHYARLVRLVERFPALLLLTGQYPAGDNLCIVTITHPSGEYRLWIDDKGQPKRLVRQGRDPMLGPVEEVVQYHGWDRASAVPLARRLEYQVDGKLVRREIISELTIETPPAGTAPQDAVTLPLPAIDAIDAGLAQWYLGRVAGGAPAEGYAAQPVIIETLGNRLFHIVGGSHHQLLIEGSDTLAVVDAPFDERRSRAVLAALEQRWPGKPVSHLILSHHHDDHAGGFLAYVQQGAKLVVSRDGRRHFALLLAKAGYSKPQIEVLSGTHLLSLPGTRVELIPLPNSHAEDMLIVYDRHNGVVYNSDLYSPGRQAQHPLWAREFARQLEWLGIEQATIAGGHGRGVISLAELRAELDSNTNQ